MAFAGSTEIGPSRQESRFGAPSSSISSAACRVEPPIVRVGQGLLRLAALVPSGSIGVGTGYPVE
jgi:hypothetical protein